MTANLHPMSLGEILDRTFQIYRSAFLAFLGVALLPLTARMALYLLGFVFDSVVSQTTLSAAVKRGLTGDVDWFASRIADGFVIFLVWPLFALLVSQVVMGGKLDIRSALRECVGRWQGWLVLGGCFWLIGSELPRQLRQVFFKPWLAMPFWLSVAVSTLEGFVLIAPLLLSFPVWSIERVSVSKAIARSWTLSKRAYGRMFIAWLLSDVIGWSIGLLLNFFTYTLLIRQNYVSYGHSSTGRSLLISLPVYVSTSVIAPLVPIAITVIYYDQRIRLEGVDIEWMMEAAGMNEPVPASGAEVGNANTSIEETQG